MTDPRDHAEKAHKGQTYGSEPYLVHLDAVWEIVRTVDDSAEARAAAYLHDAVEDTGATVGGLTLLFGPLVASAVGLVTDPEGYPNRKTRKAALHASLSALDPRAHAHRLALLVKAADRLANVRASAADSPGKLKMYRKEHAAFRAATYRPGLCDAIWRELDNTLHPPEMAGITRR
jgi:(p)ppGpp synthase/HD superfamily hydrolase